MSTLKTAFNFINTTFLTVQKKLKFHIMGNLGGKVKAKDILQNANPSSQLSLSHSERAG